MTNTEKPNKRGPKRENSSRRRQNRKQEIVELATRLMRERGYHGVSLQAIADELNVTEPAFYYYFRSKEELLYTILKQSVDHAVTSMETLVSQDAPAAVRLKQAIFSFTDMVLEQLPAFTVYFQDKGKLSAERAVELTTEERRFVHLIAEVIRQGVKSGECRGDVDPVVAAFTLIGASAWTYKWYSPGGQLSREQLSEQVADLCIETCLTERGRQALTADG